MEGTFRTRNGVKVRSASARRFIVTQEHNDRAHVIYRTDDLYRARTRFNREALRDRSTSLIDTLARKVWVDGKWQ